MCTADDNQEVIVYEFGVFFRVRGWRDHDLNPRNFPSLLATSHSILSGASKQKRTMARCISKTRSAKEAKCGTSLVAQWLRIACQRRGHGFELWSGKIPHAAEQLSPCATTTEPVL